MDQNVNGNAERLKIYGTCHTVLFIINVYVTCTCTHTFIYPSSKGRDNQKTSKNTLNERRFKSVQENGLFFFNFCNPALKAQILLVFSCCVSITSHPYFSPDIFCFKVNFVVAFIDHALHIYPFLIMAALQVLGSINLMWCYWSQGRQKRLPKYPMFWNRFYLEYQTSKKLNPTISGQFLMVYHVILSSFWGSLCL